MSSIGVNHLRNDAEVKVRGEAKYTTDLNFKDMLFGAIFRSPIAAGKIISIDTSLAEAADGVIKVITSKDAPSHRHGLVVADQKIFASDEITYAGEPIAAIAANTRTRLATFSMRSLYLWNFWGMSNTGAVDRNRTDDLFLTMEMLYRLSYNGVKAIVTDLRCIFKLERRMREGCLPPPYTTRLR
jgi:hypothetical protein